MLRYSAPTSAFRPSEAKPSSIRAWSSLTLAILLGVMGSAAAILFGLLQVSSALLSFPWTSGVAPVAIPFKADASSCKESGRVWQEDRCLDYTHDPTF